MTIKQAVLRFVDAINSGDVGGLALLMTENHVFVDSDGSKTTGREAMQKSWSQFFSMVPGYRIDVEETLRLENKVVLIGVASGGCGVVEDDRTGRSWAVPAAWRAVVEGHRIAVWQVFVNPEPIRAAVRATADTHSVSPP
jgi:uncharacterized protein (TIGR02246 family)